MALDPLTQQIIQTRDDDILITSWSDTIDAKVSATSYYENGQIEQTSYAKQPDGSYIFTFDTTLDVGMQSAIYYGINNNLTNIQRQTVFSCPTPKCEWLPYNSLSVCTECNDVPDSNLVRVVGNSTELLSAYYGVYDGFTGRKDSTAFQLPNGQFIVNLDGRVSYSSTEAQTTDADVQTFVMSAKGTGNPSKTLTLQHRENLIWALSVLNLDQGENHTIMGIWPNIPLVAKECGVYWCVNQYDSKVENDTLSEVVTEVSAPRNAQKWNNVAGTWKDESLEFHEETNMQIPDMLELCVPSGNPCYSVTVDSVWSLNNHFNKTFLSNVTVQNASVGLGPDQLQNQAHLIGTAFEPYNFKSLWNLDKQDLQNTFQNMAKSMTNEIRAFGSGISSNAMEDEKPTLEMTVTVFSMQWPYIILHCLLIVLGAVFVQLTARSSAIGGVPSYKSSSVAILSCKSSVSDIMEGAGTLREIEKKAAENKVHLTLNKGTYMRIEGNTAE
jgi:hypothetical protein